MTALIEAVPSHNNRSLGGTRVNGSLWEYRVVRQTENPIENQSKLNRLGKEGWELVAISHLSTGSGGLLAAYLKRLRETNGTGDTQP